ncbi:MAG: hypothetical protein NUV34_04250, partial [Sulfuricaulis sp.]|nr:hypothetical protein [Sulfuricaulis sp.]
NLREHSAIALAAPVCPYDRLARSKLHDYLVGGAGLSNEKRRISLSKNSGSRTTITFAGAGASFGGGTSITRLGASGIELHPKAENASMKIGNDFPVLRCNIGFLPFKFGGDRRHILGRPLFCRPGPRLSRLDGFRRLGLGLDIPFGVLAL